MFYHKLYEIEGYEAMPKGELAKAEHDSGRRLLKELLAQIGIDSYSIAIGESGKPYLEGLDYHFSISHSHGLVICAIADVPIGVDIERLTPISKDKARLLGERFFTDEENERLQKDEYSSKTFYFIWTRKEALSKLLGTPLMSSISSNTLASDDISTTFGTNYVYSVMIKK